MKFHSQLQERLAATRTEETVPEALKRIIQYCEERRLSAYTWAVAGFAETMIRELEEVLHKAEK